MALTLKEIYQDTKQKYHLTLLCGQGGMSQMMNWVYISEDISNAKFLQGGELIITTGLSSYTSPDWLLQFIKAIIKQRTCGLIINVGNYLTSDDITPEILSYCEEHNFPLFTMPWETHIYDITHDYYNRIFYDTQTDNTITNAFFSVLRNDEDAGYSISVLEEYNYERSASYCVCTIQSSEKNSINETRLLHTLKSYLKEFRPDFHICTTTRTYTIICPLSDTQTDITFLTKTMKELLHRLEPITGSGSLSGGIGSIVKGLSHLPDSFKHAKAALTMASFQNQSLFCYNDMGFFKLLLAIDDDNLLKKYADGQLASLLSYDEAHHSNYTETLRQYILCDGSIQAIATAMYCHRNTVNYRLRSLRDDFGIALDDTEKRFHYLTAFYILDYLKIIA